MALLLVDDRDGRVIAELETEEEVEQILEAWATRVPNEVGHLSIVHFGAQSGSLFSTESSVTIRPR